MSGAVAAEREGPRPPLIDGLLIVIRSEARPADGATSLRPPLQEALNVEDVRALPRLDSIWAHHCLEASVALARGFLDKNLDVAEMLEVLLHRQEPAVVGALRCSCCRR
jgi:hypothetical protein